MKISLMENNLYFVIINTNIKPYLPSKLLLNNNIAHFHEIVLIGQT